MLETNKIEIITGSSSSVEKRVNKFLSKKPLFRVVSSCSHNIRKTKTAPAIPASNEIKAVEYVPAVKASPAIKADKDKGIKATPAIKAAEAVEEVAYQPAKAATKERTKTKNSTVVCVTLAVITGE